jgi:hypothetical protein
MTVIFVRTNIGIGASDDVIIDEIIIDAVVVDAVVVKTWVPTLSLCSSNSFRICAVPEVERITSPKNA